MSNAMLYLNWKEQELILNYSDYQPLKVFHIPSQSLYLFRSDDSFCKYLALNVQPESMFLIFPCVMLLACTLDSWVNYENNDQIKLKQRCDTCFVGGTVMLGCKLKYVNIFREKHPIRLEVAHFKLKLIFSWDAFWFYSWQATEWQKIITPKHFLFHLKKVLASSCIKNIP